MKFCEICDNMYYMKIVKEQGSQKLFYFCKNCSNTEKIEDEKGDNCVYNNNYNKEDYYFKYKINKFTHLDRTLPRVNNITCPSEKCPYNNENNPNKEIVYIKYDEEKMKYIYICCKCQTAWKTPEYGKKEIIKQAKI